VLNTLRKAVRAGRGTIDSANMMVRDLSGLPITTVSHLALVERSWDLRNSITAYVALAEQLAVPLITCDAKLAGSNGHHAKIELYPLS
jgi:predicted nucleic acid-binding protein